MAELDLGRVVGRDGQGVPTGGTAGQVLKKRSATDYDAEWGNEDLGLTGASVGDLARVAAVDANGRPTSWTKAPLNEIKCNKNLLDNWYFVGGGSQQGGGQFPINQRGQTSYSNDGYTIDRWKSGTYGIAEITASGVNFGKTIAPNGYNLYSQYVPIDDSWVGKTFTLSALGSEGLVKGSGVLSASNYVDTNSVSNTYSRFRYKYDNTNKCVSVDAIMDLTNIIWYAVKFELGSEQTLAHLENGEWVLNEIPDYGEELAKCQRFYRPLGIGEWFLGQSDGTDHHMWLSAKFDPPMAGTPTLSIIDTNINFAGMWIATDINNTSASIVSANANPNGVIYACISIPNQCEQGKMYGCNKNFIAANADL